METIATWNALTALREPSVADALRIAPRTPLPVSRDGRVQLVAQNVAVRVHPTTSFVGTVPLLAVGLPLVANFYPAIPTIDITDVSWAGIPLHRANAHLFRATLADLAKTQMTLITENSLSGDEISWKLRTGAMEFEFEPTEASGRPEESHLVHVTFYFSVPHDFPFGPELSAA